MTQDRPAIVAAIIVRDGLVLLVRRRVAEDSLSWQFPTGEQDERETAEQTATRETAEEVGLAVRPLSVIGARQHPVTGRRMIYVACESVGGEASIVDSDELAELAWSDREDLSAKVADGLFQPVREYLHRHLRQLRRCGQSLCLLHGTTGDQCWFLAKTACHSGV